MNSKVNLCTQSLQISALIFSLSNSFYMNILIYVYLLIGCGFWQVDAPNEFTWMHSHQTWLDGSGGKEDDMPWFI